MFENSYAFPAHRETVRQFHSQIAVPLMKQATRRLKSDPATRLKQKPELRSCTGPAQKKAYPLRYSGVGSSTLIMAALSNADLAK